MPRGIPKSLKFNAKQNKLISAVVDHGDAKQAYRDAGYKWFGDDGNPAKYLSSKVYQALHRTGVQEEIQRLREEKRVLRDTLDEFTLDWVRREHVKLMELALLADDLPSATRNLEGIAKTGGLYVDTQRIDLGEQSQLTEHQLLEAKRLAELLVSLSIKQLPEPEPDAVEAFDIEVVEIEQNSTLEQSSSDNGIVPPNSYSSPLQSIVEPLDLANTMDQSLADDDVRD